MAKAIVEYAKKFREDGENPVWPEARDFQSITGHGVKAVVRNKEINVGNKSLMLDLNILVFQLMQRKCLQKLKEWLKLGFLCQ